MSEYLRRKLRTYFATFDFNRDGVILRDDEWMEMSTRFANFEQADKKKAERLRIEFALVWEQMALFNEAGQKDTLTIQQFVDSFIKQRYSPELMKRFALMLSHLLDLMDLNNDGYFEEDEYALMFTQAGVPDVSFAKEAFKVIDINHEGKVSVFEFLFTFFDFLFSEDENSPYGEFFGPLVD